MKHDHKKTSKLKVCLFSIIMLLPCFAVGITCLTHVFNKEVTEETETATINYKYELGINPTTPLDSKDKLWKINIDSTTNTSISVKYAYDGTKIYESTDERYLDIFNNEISIATDMGATIFDINNTYIVPTYLNGNEINLLSSGINEYNQIKSVTITTNPQDQTTNIFYDSCDQVKQSFILNWCDTNNPIKSGVTAFTNVFALPNDHIINTLITYWFSISMIYIVIDIIIECIIYITHFFNKEM